MFNLTLRNKQPFVNYFTDLPPEPKEATLTITLSEHMLLTHDYVTHPAVVLVDLERAPENLIELCTMETAGVSTMAVAQGNTIVFQTTTSHTVIKCKDGNTTFQNGFPFPRRLKICLPLELFGFEFGDLIILLKSSNSSSNREESRTVDCGQLNKLDLKVLFVNFNWEFDFEVYTEFIQHREPPSLTEMDTSIPDSLVTCQPSRRNSW